MLKAKTFKDLHLDLDHSISDDNDGDYENNLRRAGMDAGRETNNDIEKYKRTLTVDKASTALKKVIQRDYRSGKMKNKRVIPNKQDIKKQEARNLLDNDISDKDSSDI